MLGANDAIFDYCSDYATPLFFVAPVALLGMALQSFFISASKPGLGMTFSLLGGVVNIFFDWLLIAKLGMETTGAALARLFHSGNRWHHLLLCSTKRDALFCPSQMAW